MSSCSFLQRKDLISGYSWAYSSTAKIQNLVNNLHVSSSKVLIKNWIDIRRNGTVRVRHEVPHEMKSSAVTDGLKRLWANTYKSKPRGKPTNAKNDFHRHKHGDHFPIDCTVTGGAGGCLNPRVFSGVHFHPDGSVQGCCRSDRNARDENKVANSVCSVVIHCFQEVSYKEISAVRFSLYFNKIRVAK